jgi:subtilase family serine protease
MRRLLLAALSALLLPALVLSAPASAGVGASLKTVEVLLELRHPAGLDRFVGAVSDPASSRYRDYSTVERLARRFGASPRDRQRTIAWLTARGLHGRVGPTGTYVTVPVSAARAARLLPPPAGARASAAGLSRAVPVALRGAVSAAAILDNGAKVFKNVASASSAEASKEKLGYSSILPHSGTAKGCGAGRLGPGAPISPPFTPNQYLTAYGIKGMHKRGLQGQGQTVALVEIDGFHRADIEGFDKCFGAKTPPIRVVPVVPNSRPYTAGTETTLDLEVLSAAAPRLDRINVFEGVGNEAGIMLTAGTALGSRGNHPDVISVSLGVCEPKYSERLVYRRALDSIFAVAAGAGISVLVAAGDTGSAGCRIQLPDGGTSALPLRTVSLPSSSPYVTAVGGTNLSLSAQNRIDSELVWNDYPELAGAGGGGVSLLSPERPWWQRRVSPAFGLGRIVPDVAALADVFPGYTYLCTSPECGDLPQFANPGWTSIGGTSAATPLMAAGVALANQYAARERQPRLGFLNPLLYELGARPKSRRGVFRDVSKGNDDVGPLLPKEVGGGHLLGCCEARPGYDWASGWGSLKVVGLARAAARASG